MHTNTHPQTQHTHSYLVSKYESGHSVISSLTANATALSELYLAHARPLVGQMTKQNFDRVYRHRPMLVAYYEIDWEENIKSEEDIGSVS